MLECFRGTTESAKLNTYSAEDITASSDFVNFVHALKANSKGRNMRRDPAKKAQIRCNSARQKARVRRTKIIQVTSDVRIFCHSSIHSSIGISCQLRGQTERPGTVDGMQFMSAKGAQSVCMHSMLQ